MGKNHASQYANFGSLPSVASHFFIQTIPTLILFKNGKQVWRQSGVIDPVNLNKIINMFK